MNKWKTSGKVSMFSESEEMEKYRLFPNRKWKNFDVFRIGRIRENIDFFRIGNVGIYNYI